MAVFGIKLSQKDRLAKGIFLKEEDDEGMVGLNYNFNVLEILNDLARSGAKISTPHLVKNLKLKFCPESIPLGLVKIRPNLIINTLNALSFIKQKISKTYFHYP